MDSRALEILFSTYWEPSGWKKNPATPPDDLTYAKAAGVMFDRRRFNHDEMVDWALRSRSKVRKELAANAFLASLSSRRLDWRSALGSFAASTHLPSHHWSKRTTSQFSCPVCGSYESSDDEDLSVLNFERHKWGGVRHDQPLYIGFDLELFHREKPDEPTESDRIAMRKILELASSLPRDAKLSDLARELAGVFPSNLNERRTLIGILGYCGILHVASKPEFFKEFPPVAQRQIVPWTKNDWPYPVQWWTGADGVSREATVFWFPAL